MSQVSKEYQVRIIIKVDGEEPKNYSQVISASDAEEAVSKSAGLAVEYGNNKLDSDFSQILFDIRPYEDPTQARMRIIGGNTKGTDRRLPKDPLQLD
jgi:hypothetical protein